MKCKNCGAELTPQTKYCPYCRGEVNKDALDSEYEKLTIDNFKNHSKSFCQRFSLFEKISILTLALFSLLVIVALLFRKLFALVFSIISIVLIVISIIKKKKNANGRLHILTFAIAITMLFPYIFTFISASGSIKGTAINWTNILLGKEIPQPKSNTGEIISNSEDNLLVYVHNTPTDDFYEYINACKESGFTVDTDQSTYSFEAYNEAGYKLSLHHTDSDCEMRIDLEAPTKYGELKWSDSELAKLLPKPVSTVGEISKDDEKGFEVTVAETTIEDFINYSKQCEKTFSENVQKTDKSYSATNKDGYRLSIRYLGYDVMSISISEPEYNVNIEVECSENLIFSKYDVKVYINELLEGTLKHGATETYSLSLTKGTYPIKVVSEEDEEVTGTAKFDVTKEEDIKFKISCYNSKISVETISGTKNNDDKTNKISVTMNKDEIVGLDKNTAEKKIKEMGFTNIEYDTIDTDDKKLNNKINDVKIQSWIFKDDEFSKGDSFDTDAIITLCYYVYKEPEKPSPVFYSTNDYETAKKGNTGVFSYVDRGNSYDIYYIIDFDEGYVYYFTDGNGENFCDRLKIESGDLNTNIKITYHDGDTQWSYKFHFKYENHPETLIMIDQNGFDLEYSTTDLDDALSIRDTKTIKDY